MTILSDCQVLIHALCDPKHVDHKIQPLIYDILNVISNFFSSCNAIKVNRSLVNPAHRLAKYVLSYV